MSEEKQEKGILDQIVALIKGDKQEPVQEEVVAEVPVDFEAKFNELDVEMKAQIEDHKAELDKLKELHVEALAQAEASHKAELEEVVAKVEVVAKAFEDGKLSVIEAKEELKSEAKAEEVAEKVEGLEDKFSADVAKDEIIEEQSSKYSVWMSMELGSERNKYFKENEEEILEESRK